ncbi:MAG: hypothetical protein LBT00_16485 [Spirochaetaceae bacterium]|nr:hypothetical protein [Spirochaetaceae bacterium]
MSIRPKGAPRHCERAPRHCERSEAIQWGPSRLDCFAALHLAMTSHIKQSLFARERASGVFFA